MREVFTPQFEGFTLYRWFASQFGWCSLKLQNWRNMMSLDDRQEIVVKTFGRKELENMDLADVVKLIGEAGPNAKFRGKGIVTRPDGSIRYDSDATPGNFGETAEELQAHAARESTVKAFGEDHLIDGPLSTTKPVSS